MSKNVRNREPTKLFVIVALQSLLLRPKILEFLINSLQSFGRILTRARRSTSSSGSGCSGSAPSPAWWSSTGDDYYIDDDSDIDGDDNDEGETLLPL